MSRITRRQFVAVAAQGAAIAAGAAALADPKPSRAVGASEKVVLALVGAGGRGHDLALKFANVRNVEFKYVCEVDERRGGNTVDELEKIQGRRPKRVVDMHEAFGDKDVHAAQLGG